MLVAAFEKGTLRNRAIVPAAGLVGTEALGFKGIGEAGRG